MSEAISAKNIMSSLMKLVKNTKGSSINELRLILALERAVARIEAHAKLSRHLVFKGGFVLLKTINSDRFTRDVDALAIDLSRKQVPKLIEDPSVKTRPSTKRLSRIHLDVGFGDPIETLPKKQVMTSILTIGEPISWSVYPFEYIFAEKLEALFSRGSANSRAKDIYDMPLIYKQITNQKNLYKAIVRTFNNRKTPIPESFFSVAQEYQLEVMRNSWPSVELLDNKPTFDKTWADFLKILQALDSSK